MERVRVIVCVAMLTTVSAIMAEPPSSYGAPSNSYGTPSFSNFNSNNNFRNQDTSGFQNFRNSLSSSSSGVRGSDGGQLGASISGPKVFRHISLFIAPQENEPQQQVRTIRAQTNPDKHVQIIFVKAPSASNSQKTEVILPEQPQQKTLVYVLVKKAESSNNVKVRGPAPTQPPKPEVYFIKYRDDKGNSATGQIGGGSGGYNNGGSSFGTNSVGALPIRSSSVGSFSTSYGAP